MQAKTLALAAAALITATVLAGCDQAPPPAPYTPKSAVDAGVPLQTLGCHLLGAGGKAVTGTCQATVGTVPVSGVDQPEYVLQASTDADGMATLQVPANATVFLEGSAGGVTKAARLVADLPKAVTFTMNGTAGAPADFTDRSWTAPITVDDSAAGAEPQIAVDSKGTIYYSLASHFDQGSRQGVGLLRSTDGGHNFTNVSPQAPAALPTLASDDAIQVAPDDSVWFARYIGYPENTIGCTSTTQGDSWTCDNAAIPGVTDRMWIAGLSATEGYLQSGEGLTQPQWAHTITGSLKYAPYASQATIGQHGNMVYDATNKAVWQITQSGSSQAVMRVDGATGTIATTATTVPATYAIPWIAVANGTLWTTGESAKQGVIAAHSADQGKTWVQAPVSVMPKSVTFSYIAAGGHRAAAIYYGSDKKGASPANGGNWSLYAAESDDAAVPGATWVETRLVDLVHKGNICIGLNCEQTGGDPQARDAGDLIGIAMDAQGNAHLAYIGFVTDAHGDYIRQVAS